MIEFRRKLIIIIIFLLYFIIIKVIYNEEYFNPILKFKYDEISIIVNMKKLTKNKHFFFYNIMRQLNSTRNFYFIKTLGKTLNDNLNNLVGNSSIKIVQSNFPDSIFLPLVVSLFGDTIPKFVLFIDGEELMFSNGNNLIKWIVNAYKKIMINNYDYIFGNYQIIKGKKIGCSLLFSKASIIEHLLYYTDSDTSHANPFFQLSLATKTKFCIISLNYIKASNLENISNKFSIIKLNINLK